MIGLLTATKIAIIFFSDKNYFVNRAFWRIFAAINNPNKALDMKELIITNNWERHISNAIRTYKDNDSFPKLSSYGIERTEFDDYVVEKQYLLDRLERRKTSLAIPGTLLILPVVAISMFTDSVTGLFAGVSAGVVFAATYMFSLNAIDKKRLRKLYDEKIEQYINDVLSFKGTL